MRRGAKPKGEIARRAVKRKAALESSLPGDKRRVGSYPGTGRAHGLPVTGSRVGMTVLEFADRLTGKDRPRNRRRQ